MELQITKWSMETSEFINNARKILLAAENASGMDLHSERIPDSAFKDDKPLEIVFVGQYSAGKSSILAMLTGDKHIAIGEGITTQSTESFSWNGLTIVDTPGIHSSLRPDHDEITYTSIAKADMLVYVVTNELFDSELAEHFRRLAIERDKAGEMLLVVNKVCRGGINQAYLDVLREGLRSVLDPLTPEELNVSFVDAKSWLDAQTEEDPEIRVALLDRCGREQLIENMNKFVADRGLQARLTTPLYETEGVLNDAMAILQPSSGDIDVDGIEEHLRQQRHILDSCRRGIESETEQVYFRYAERIRAQGQTLSSQIELGCDADEINEQIEAVGRDVERLADECSREIEEVISKKLQEAELSMGALLASDFSIKLDRSLNLRKDPLPPVVSALLQQSGTTLSKAGTAVMKSASKTGTATLASGVKEFSGTQLHNTVKNVGHFFKVKFKPYQALKITKGLATAAKAASVLGVALDLGMNAKEDYDRAKADRDIKRCRQDVRQSFNKTADELERTGREGVRKLLQDPEEGLEKAIHTIDGQIGEIRLSRKNKTSYCEEIESLLVTCHEIIGSIRKESIKESSIPDKQD